MTKPHPHAELDQARLDRGRRRFGANPQTRRGSRHTSVASPTGSTAATTSSRRVCSGRSPTRRRKFSSISPDNPSRREARTSPASCCEVNPRERFQ